jgi:hypothetical protein
MSNQELIQAWQRLADTLENPGFDRRSYIERLNTLAEVNGYDRTAGLTEMVRAIVEDFGLRNLQSGSLIGNVCPKRRAEYYLQGKIDGLDYLTQLAKKDLRLADPKPPQDDWTPPTEPQPTARQSGKVADFAPQLIHALRHRLPPNVQVGVDFATGRVVFSAVGAHTSSQPNVQNLRKVLADFGMVVTPTTKSPICNKAVQNSKPWSVPNMPWYYGWTGTGITPPGMSAGEYGRQIHQYIEVLQRAKPTTYCLKGICLWVPDAHRTGPTNRPCTSVRRAACQAGDPTARRLGWNCWTASCLERLIESNYSGVVAARPCSEVAREGCWTVTPKWLNTPWIQTCCFASCGGLWPSPDAKACRSKASDYARTCTSTGPQHCESADRKYTIMPGCGHLCT